MGGSCKAVVVAVGENSTRGIEGEKLDTRDQETELTAKLANIGGSLKFVALISSIVVLIVALLVTTIEVAASKDVEGSVYM